MSRPSRTPREPCVGERQVHIQDTHFGVLETNFLALVLEWRLLIEAAATSAQSHPVPPPNPTPNPHPRCFIPEVNVKHVMAAQSVIKEMWRCQSPG